jgi:hypothetical protein
VELAIDSCLDTSASASSWSTLAVIFSKAAIELPEPTPASMSLT